MNGQKAWDHFLRTGQVADYLRYAAESRQNCHAAQQGEEWADAGNDPRADRPREDIRG